MARHQQSSRFRFVAAEAVRLLRYPPYRVKLQAAQPLLHYHAPMGIWLGAPVHYALVSGAFTAHWSACVVSLEAETAFHVKQMIGPFARFAASHSFLEDSQGLHEDSQCLIVRDEFDFEGSPWDSLLCNTLIHYGFDARQVSAEPFAEAPTQSFQALDDSAVSGA